MEQKSGAAGNIERRKYCANESSSLLKSMELLVLMKLSYMILL